MVNLFSLGDLRFLRDELGLESVRELEDLSDQEYVAALFL